MWTDTERDLIRDEIGVHLDGLDHYVDFVDDVDIVAVWSVGRLPTGRITMLDRAGIWLCEPPSRMSSDRDGIEYTISYKFKAGRRALDEMRKVRDSAGLDDLENPDDGLDDGHDRDPEGGGPYVDPDGGLDGGLDFSDVEIGLGGCRDGGGDGGDLDFSGLDDPDPDLPKPEPDGMEILERKGRLSW
ncbi:MAG: hypothetical protein MPK62_00530 [Alphaproteobacteria bacterium]|nr:hypothetical protein [Alphaproteobacteria bacterium]MDA8029624.1 hypothetical protein [Alphaproteobacteria bacterium]